ncbi:MAG: bifunctional D-glycero-beta-D-manno-heptose-7-phosphate kinase/D-glycero-beta-D-manno-heptose 1-phosphate adenylyltransferase HldE [Alphaproteobacteria bacterium]
MDDLATYLAAFPKAHVLCVGDLMLDRYVYGTVSRISPEAPIPVLNVDREFYTLGGVGNVAANIAALGATPHMVGILGKDVYGETLKGLCTEKNISPKPLLALPHFQTILKNRYCSQQQQLLRVDYEKIQTFDKDVYDKILDQVEKLMPQVKVLVLSDYGKGVLHPDYVLKPLLKMAQAHKIPTIVDPKGKDFSIYRGATLVTPNRKELQEATSFPCKTNAEVEKAAHWLIQNTGIHNVLATRSEEGMTLVQDKKSPLHYPTQAKEVFDVSGAGDTVVATLAVGLAANVPLEKAVSLANLAGSIVVGKIGTATVSPQEILDSQFSSLSHLYADKIGTVSQAQDQIRKWRKKGYKVGFTNGCFDLLHKGHIFLLHEAHKTCDRLIVGLNSDASVKTLKGPSRPIKDQEERSLILASLQDVDFVTIFSEETPLKLIEALEPDVLIKGSDYTVDKVVGGPFVKARGGQVVLINLVDGFSTTGTIKSMSGE